MKNIIYFFILPYAIIIFLFYTKISSSTQNDETVLQNHNEENQSGEKKVFIKEDLALKKLYSDQDTICDHYRKNYEYLGNVIDNYMQRYINLFLITSNLKNYEVQNFEELIQIDLEISIKGEDLFYLQKFSKNRKDSDYPKNLAKLDAIFSNIARLKERSYMESTMKSSMSFFRTFIMSVLNNSRFHHYLPFLTILLILAIIYKFYYHKFYPIIVVLINSLIIWDSINLYNKKIKEMDVEIHLNMLKLKHVPKDCSPEYQKWYDGFLGLFFESDCAKYYKNLVKNSSEEIFLFDCLLETYGYYLLQVPLKILGASIKDFTGEISSLWPRPFQYFINVPLALFFILILCFVMFIMCGKRLNVSFFGASLKLDSGEPKVIQENITITNSPESITMGGRRKLKPWTTVKSPRRLEMNPIGRRKLYLKSINSFFKKSDRGCFSKETVDNSNETVVNSIEKFNGGSHES